MIGRKNITLILLLVLLAGCSFAKNRKTSDAEHFAKQERQKKSALKYINNYLKPNLFTFLSDKQQEHCKFHLIEKEQGKLEILITAEYANEIWKPYIPNMVNLFAQSKKNPPPVPVRVKMQRLKGPVPKDWRKFSNRRATGEGLIPPEEIPPPDMTGPWQGDDWDTKDPIED